MRDILTTPRLKLRPPLLSDAPVMAKLMNEPDILRMTASPAPIVFSLSIEFLILNQLSQRQRGLGFAYAITDIETGHVMGEMDLFANRDGGKEIGYWIGRPYWGQGFITEAAKALIAESFESLSIAHIDAGVFSDNPASCRVLEKLGFTIQNQDGNTFSIARGKRAAGIELRLHRKTAMNMLGTDPEQNKPQAQS